MATFRNLILAIGLFALFGACGDSTKKAYEQSTTEAQAFDGITNEADATSAVIDQYMQLNRAFVETDAAKAKQAAATFVKHIGDIADESLSEEYLNALAAIEQRAAAISQSDDIEEQRSLFVPLTDQLYAMVKEFPTDQTIYYAYCPMAFGDTGGYWLTREKEILNPYFGDKMLRCGVIKEAIEGL
jgi:Cu(I)/Ag(I) efflux system membrane fusion protein